MRLLTTQLRLDKSGLGAMGEENLYYCPNLPCNRGGPNSHCRLLAIVSSLHVCVLRFLQLLCSCRVFVCCRGGCWSDRYRSGHRHRAAEGTEDTVPHSGYACRHNRCLSRFRKNYKKKRKKCAFYQASLFSKFSSRVFL